MIISKKSFEEMKAKYDEEVKKGKPGKDKVRDISNQTNWESYTKEDLLSVLNQDGVIGLKFHLTEYTQETAKEFYGADADQYIGRINLVYSPIYTDSGAEKREEEYYDKGNLCPPTCQ